MTDLLSGPFRGLTLATVGRRLREGATGPVELARAALSAIDNSQPALNAFVTVDHEGALRAAAQAAGELSGGLDRGPLHGIPVAVKDLVDTAGLTTTMGSRHFAGHVPDRDAEVVARLRAAGAVIVGKTTTHEFAYGPTGDRAANGPGANPHDPGGWPAAPVPAPRRRWRPDWYRSPSLPTPAARCASRPPCAGSVASGPRPTALPAEGVFPLSWSLDTVGVLAGDVAGTATGWAVLSGVPMRPGGSPPVEALRIGLPDGFDRLADEVHSGLSTLVARLGALGLRPVPVAVPDLDELRWLYRTIQSVEAVAVHHQRMTGAPELFDPEVLARLRSAAEVPRARLRAGPAPHA